jgi:hypothetical protein
MTRPCIESAISALDVYVSSVIAKAPPLSATQRQLLTVLLTPRGGDSWKKN